MLSLWQRLEDLGDDDIALGPHLKEKTCDWFRLKTIISLMKPVTGFFLYVIDLLVLQGTSKSTRKKSQEYGSVACPLHFILIMTVFLLLLLRVKEDFCPGRRPHSGTIEL